MTQNIYDDETFFAGYSKLGRSVEGLEGAAEWPVLRALLPDLRGGKVLDLGCGFGWFSRWAREAGAAEVLGIDVSEKMLERARETTNDAAIGYVQQDLERLALPPASYDVVYSSLAFHYIENLRGLVEQVHRGLVEGGSFVFSVEHPMYTAPSEPTWVVDTNGNRTWPVDRYLEEGPGFALTHVEEWGPTAEQIKSRPALAAERHRPPFLLVAARR